MRYRLQVLAKRAGVRYPNPHSFRHAFAHQMLEVEDVLMLKDQLGHLQVATTERYLQERSRQAGVRRMIEDNPADRLSG